MKILLETGWSDYIPGGVIFGNPSLHEKTPEEKDLSRVSSLRWLKISLTITRRKKMNLFLSYPNRVNNHISYSILKS